MTITKHDAPVSLDDCLDERDRLDEAFRGVNGVAECLLLAAESIHDVKDVCAYLHAQLLKHAEAGKAAFEEIWAKRGAA